MSKEIPHKLVKLHQPSLEEVAKVLQDGLSKNFATVSVDVVDCPNLTEKPFMLAAPGLCGSPRVADVGGVPYLLPLVQRDKIYNLTQVAEWAELPEAFVIGAGAGPSHQVGINSEMIPNMKLSKDGCHNNSHICKLSSQGDASYQYHLEQINSTECNVLMNVFLSKGQAGKVLRVRSSGRTGEETFANCLKASLKDVYGTKPVAVGGTFCLTKGKAKIHVMPDFSKTPLKSSEDVNNWLQFFEMDAPLISTGYTISHDPELDLRVEHFHCFSDHGQGGHYHYDTSPQTCEYLGYFNVAEFLLRVDQPVTTHMIGRE